MIYRLTSAKKVVAKVLTDTDVQEENIRVTDKIIKNENSRGI